ncbi:MAG: hypothetical protein JSS66_05625 [Armatimonadetes bacterium]|nr:hypothetical protein [Armatimonadota bacterium]
MEKHKDVLQRAAIKFVWGGLVTALALPTAVTLGDDLDNIGLRFLVLFIALPVALSPLLLGSSAAWWDFKLACRIVGAHERRRRQVTDQG